MLPQIAVCFDLDATLVAYDRTTADRLADEALMEASKAGLALDMPALSDCYRSVSVKLWRKADDDIWVNAPRSINGLDIMLEAFRQALAACGCHDDAIVRRCFDYYWSQRAGIFQAYDDVVSTLESLRPSCKLAVITNGPCVTQPDKLEILGLDRYFDLIVCSGEVGASKPDPVIFRHTLYELQATPAGSLHVGDQLVPDVGGANGAGLTSVWINRTGHQRSPADPQPTYEITTLLDLKPIVRTLQAVEA